MRQNPASEDLKTLQGNWPIGIAKAVLALSRSRANSEAA